MALWPSVTSLRDVKLPAPGSSDSGCSRRRNGFTLVEVLVAMAIVSFALPALMLLISQQIQSTKALRDQTVAYWLVDNQMNRLRLQHQLTGAVPQAPIDDRAEMLDTTWYWRMEPEKTVSQLIRIQISVGRDDSEDPLVVMETYLDG